MRPVIPSVATFINVLIIVYWGAIILDTPIVVNTRDIGYTLILLSILLVDWLNKRQK